MPKIVADVQTFAEIAQQFAEMGPPPEPASGDDTVAREKPFPRDVHSK